jgi:dipeptidyl aminopeptidase/acylaminoacyl peptidase
MRKMIRYFLAATLLLPLSLLHSQEGKKVFSLEDYPRWSRIVSAAISDNGEWATYGYKPLKGDDTLYFRNLTSNKVFARPYSTNPSFSPNSQWVAYFRNLPEKKAEALRKSSKKVYRTAVVMNLGSAAEEEWDRAESIQFSPASDIILVKKVSEVAESRGSDLIIKNLAEGWMMNLGNVREFSFNRQGTMLAFTVDATARTGNGLYLFDVAGQTIRALDTDTLEYTQLTWDDDMLYRSEWGTKGSSLAVLKGSLKDSDTERSNTLVIVRNTGTAKQSKITYSPSTATGFPDGYVLSEYGSLSFTLDNSGIMLSIKEQTQKVKMSRDTIANVDVWHYADEQIQSVQMRQAAGNRRSAGRAILWFDKMNLVTLSDDNMRTVTMNREGTTGVGRDPKPYISDTNWGGAASDFYIVDGKSGSRTLIEKGITRPMGLSPDSKYFIYFKEGHFLRYDVAKKSTVNISANVAVNFNDEEEDHPYPNPSYGFAGWTKDGKSVIVNHRFDLWSLNLDGSGGVNLTGNYGTENSIVLRIARTDDDPYTDLKKPLLLTAYGEWTKMSGYSRLVAGKAPVSLLYDDASFSRFNKARNADKYLFTRQTFSDFPDYYVSGSQFSDIVRITDANPQQADYAWGRSILVDFTNSKGDRLQATVTLPAGYVPGKRYPAIVYFYEKMSQNHHSYSMPAYDDRPHFSAYASDGYLIVRPDMKYYEGQPGWNALDCLTEAVKKVVAEGYADPARIGLQGHSWGGYQSSFVVTQTDIFACVVTGAPVTNLTSMYNILYKNSGTNNHGIMETGQVRMGKSLFDDFENYAAQSPVFNAPGIKTPFMILHGTEDGAVDWSQGLEFYNAARRLGKQVILLSYPGENHHLAVENNSKDFLRRMKQYFDHYLKGAPAPEWMIKGVPFIQKPYDLAR